MSDHADTVREALHALATLAGNFEAAPNRVPRLINEQVATIGLSLDALVAERDEAQRLYELFRERYESKYTEWNASKTNAVKAAALGKWAVAIISNVSEGDLTQQAQEWQDAAHKWLDEFHAPARAALAEDA